MQLSVRQTYAAAPDQVHAMLIDEEFLRRTAADLGARDVTVVAAPDASQVDVTIDAPAEARVFVGPQLRLRLKTMWADAVGDTRTAGVAIDVLGQPVTVKATAELAPTASGSTLTYEGELKASVPFLAAMIEKIAEPEVLAALASQERVGAAWLAERG